MNPRHPTTRRRFLARLALGCAGVLGLHPWSVAVPTVAVPDDAAKSLALRIVQAMGTAPVSWHAAASTRSIPELLSTTFEPAALAHLMQLNTTQLKRWLAARIVADYQKGALVHHHGWWLARSEAAILELGCLLTQRRVQLR